MVELLLLVQIADVYSHLHVLHVLHGGLFMVKLPANFFQSIREPLDVEVNQPSLLKFREFGTADVCFHLHVLHALHGGFNSGNFLIHP